MAYEATGVDALFFTGIKTASELEAISAATTLPIVLGGYPRTNGRSRIPRQPARADRAAGPRAIRRRDAAVYETLKALREGTPPKDLRAWRPPS